ncbi:ATP-binding protein [Streptomyces californicus]|uniref:ATP-binding protein n=1 Tax=Streptomyces californicus TaxID=67351 RepID=UPI00296FD173|nr:ATP-binding protein [Streptomyces californicus]MDW4914920.1 ATP-binding protein [Streptomyces californicus]
MIVSEVELLDRVRFLGRPTVVRTSCVEVSDAVLGRVPGQPKLSDDDQETGRGLFLVEAVARRWGWESRNPVGKTV